MDNTAEVVKTEPEVKQEEVVKEPEAVKATPVEDLFNPNQSILKPSVKKDKVEVVGIEDDKTEPKKETETKPAAETEKKEELPDNTKKEFNWDDDTNPYKKAAADFEKRYRDTQNWGFKANQKLKEYGLDIDEAPTPEEIKAAEQGKIIAFNEREKASYHAAVEIYGKKFVDEQLYANNAPFRKLAENPVVYNTVMESDAPVLEALRIVKNEAFYNKYGRDVDKIPNKIRQEVEAEIREKITKELQGKLTKKETMPNTLTNVHSIDKNNDEVFSPTPLSALFG